MTLETWSTSVGPRGATVWVGEMAHKGMVVYLRWGKPNQYERTVTGSVRDERGRLQKRRVAEAIAEAQAKVEELAGRAHRRKDAGPMTLGQGVARAFSLEGCYPKDPDVDAYTRETRERVGYTVGLLGGPDVRWEDVTPGMIRGIWRKIQKAFPEGGGTNKAIKCVGHVLCIANYLAGEFPDQRFPRAPAQWQSELRAYWTSQGLSIEPDRPRHTEDEVRALFEHRDQADPRLLLALMLGTEARGGQLIRTLRSHCGFDGADWRIAIPYRSAKKKAPKPLLNVRERAALEWALSEGYLSLLERAYQAGEIADYALFPAGKLRDGKVPVERGREAMVPGTLRGFLSELEAAAKVESIKGRGWHGLRRAFADIYARMGADPRLLDEVQGWVPGSTMRERVYQNQDDQRRQRDASDLRLRRPGITSEGLDTANGGE